MRVKFTNNLCAEQPSLESMYARHLHTLNIHGEIVAELWRFLTPLTIYVIWLTFIVNTLPHNLLGSECLECLVPLWGVSGWRRAGQGGRAGPGIDHAATGDRMGQNSLWPRTSHYGGSGRGLSSCRLLGTEHRAHILGSGPPMGKLMLVSIRIFRVFLRKKVICGLRNGFLKCVIYWLVAVCTIIFIKTATRPIHEPRPSLATVSRRNFPIDTKTTN